MIGWIGYRGSLISVLIAWHDIDDDDWFSYFGVLSIVDFNAKTLLQEGHQWYYLTYIRRDKGAPPFPMVISPKLNVIVQL